MTFAEIGIWALLIILGLTIVTVLIFGARNATYGKINPVAGLIVISPVVILGILGVTMETWTQAGIITMLVMLGLALLAMFVTGMRGFFGMR